MKLRNGKVIQNDITPITTNKGKKNTNSINSIVNTYENVDFVGSIIKTYENIDKKTYILDEQAKQLLAEQTYELLNEPTTSN